MSDDALVITYSPVAAAGKVARWLGMVQSRVISALIVTALAAVLFFLQKPMRIDNSVATWIMIGFLALSWLWVILTVVMWLLSRRRLRCLSEGAAMTLSRSGVQMGDLTLGWEQVATFAAKPGLPLQSGTLVLADAVGNKRSLVLDDINILPADLDNAVRAYSLGSVGVDLGGLAG